MATEVGRGRTKNKLSFWKIVSFDFLTQNS